MQTPEAVLAYWLDEVGPDGWYKGGEALDQEIRDKFLSTWESAQEGTCGLWLTYPSGTLAYILLMDQFPRTMFRGTAKAFASDAAAVTAAKAAIARDWDLKIDEPARQFFYLPLMHSEHLSDQDRSVRLICARMPEAGESNLLHAVRGGSVLAVIPCFAGDQDPGLKRVSQPFIPEATCIWMLLPDDIKRKPAVRRVADRLVALFESRFGDAEV